MDATATAIDAAIVVEYEPGLDTALTAVSTTTAVPPVAQRYVVIADDLDADGSDGSADSSQNLELEEDVTLPEQVLTAVQATCQMRY